MLHGGPGATHDYLEPLHTLSNDRPVIFYDQLGCGNSEQPQDPSLWTLERSVEELSQIRTALKLQTIHLLGTSWGTMLAIEYILTKQPSGIASMILSGPCLSVSRWIADQRAYLRQLPAHAQSAVAVAEERGIYDSKEYQDAVMLYYKLHVCRLEPWPDCLQKTFARINSTIYTKMWGPSEFTCTGTLKDYERAHDLHKINIPTLFLAGRYDEARPVTTAYYQTMLPGSILRIIEDASHTHFLEKTNECLSAMRDFLSGFDKIGRDNP